MTWYFEVVLVQWLTAKSTHPHIVPPSISISTTRSTHHSSTLLWSIQPFVHPTPIQPQVHPFNHSSNHKSTHSTIHLTTSPTIHLTTSPPIHLTTSPPIQLSIEPQVHPFNHSSDHSSSTIQTFIQCHYLSQCTMSSLIFTIATL